MKRKILLCLTVASMLSSSCFALELYKGRIMNHKEWTTGNAKGIFKVVSPINSTMFKSHMQKSGSDSIFSYVYSDAFLTQGTVNAPVDISGYNYVFVANHTDLTQSYNYIFSICTTTSDQSGQCAYYQDEIQLEPGGYVDTDKQPALQVMFNKPGTYLSTINTSLSPSPDNQILGMSASGATGLVVIEGAK